MKDTGSGKDGSVNVSRWPLKVNLIEKIRGSAAQNLRPLFEYEAIFALGFLMIGGVLLALAVLQFLLACSWQAIFLSVAASCTGILLSGRAETFLQWRRIELQAALCLLIPVTLGNWLIFRATSDPFPLIVGTMFSLGLGTAVFNLKQSLRNSPDVVPLLPEAECALEPPLESSSTGTLAMVHSLEHDDFTPVDFEDEADEWESDEEEFEEAEESHVIAEWIRTTTDEQDRLSGTVVVPFVRGQKSAYLHIAFLPNFTSKPSAFAECVGSDDVRAEFDTVQRYGARLHVRRPVAAFLDDEARVSVQFLSDEIARRAA